MKSINYNQILDTQHLHVIEENFEPIFYLKEYPTAIESYTTEELQTYKYINGLKKSGRSFFINQTKYNQARENFHSVGGLERYVEDINAIIKNNNEPILVTCIPSSKVKKKNIVSRVVLRLSEKYGEKFQNGKFLFKKIEDEEAAHDVSGMANRSYKKHYDSWEKGLQISNEDKDKLVIVIDDVVTTGSSFYAAHKHLTELGFTKILYFAYGRTQQNSCLRGEMKPKSPINKPIGEIIFDVDQTLVDSIKASEYKFEEILLQKINQREIQLYEGIKEMISYVINDMQIPIIFVTNRDFYTVKAYFEKIILDVFDYNIRKPVEEDDLPEPVKIALKNSEKEQQIATFKLGKKSGYQSRYFVNIDTIDCLLSFNDAKLNGKNLCKPSNYLIDRAIDNIRKLANQEDLRIIGIGNSEYDIIAYNKSGIESILVNWGNRSALKNNFNADYVYAEIEEFIQFLKNES